MKRKTLLIVSGLAAVLVLVASITAFGIFGTSANGRIVDKRTGKPVANVSIRIGEKLGNTNKNGYYAIKVGQGNKMGLCVEGSPIKRHPSIGRKNFTHTVNTWDKT